MCLLRFTEGTDNITGFPSITEPLHGGSEQQMEAANVTADHGRCDGVRHPHRRSHLQYQKIRKH